VRAVEGGLKRARCEVDALVGWRLDRWGRSLPDLVVTLRELAELGVGFVSLTEALDRETPTGRGRGGGGRGGRLRVAAAGAGRDARGGPGDARDAGGVRRVRARGAPRAGPGGDR